MTAKEFTKLAAAIKTYYPRDNVLPTKDAMELWFDMLKDLDYQSAAVSLKKHVATSKFAPTIADIRENAIEMNSQSELNEQEAWSLVMKSLRDGANNASENFEKLPPLIQRAVGSASQLRRWATDEGFNEGYEKNGFQRTYRTLVEKDREIQKVTPDIHRMIGVVQNQAEMPKLGIESNLADKLTSENQDGLNQQIKDTEDEIQLPKDIQEKLNALKAKIGRGV